MSMTFELAETMMRRAQNGRRRLGHNTYLYEYGPDAYRVRFHYTDVVIIHRDGTYTLNNGGWSTPTTKTRINDHSPARVYSERGTWAVWSDDDPKTPARIKPCRACQGRGRVHVDSRRDYYPSTYNGRSWDYKRVFPPVIIPARYVQCWHCQGTGQRDYGSKSMPVVFFDGIRVDGTGHVIGAAGLERLYDPEARARRAAAEAAAREAHRIAMAEQARKLKRERKPWVEINGLTRRGGRVIMFKAVSADLHSAHGAHYAIGTTVTAEDYAPTAECGQGLHFSPTPAEALTYIYEDSSSTRFLACAVDYKTLIPLDDKVKARSCRVLYEVDRDGGRLTAPEPEPIGPEPMDPTRI